MNKVDEFYFLKRIYEGLGTKDDSLVQIDSTNINVEGEKQPKLIAKIGIHIRRMDSRKAAFYIETLLKGVRGVPENRVSDEIEEQTCSMLKRIAFRKLNDLKDEIKKDFSLTDKEWVIMRKRERIEGGKKDE